MRLYCTRAQGHQKTAVPTQETMCQLLAKQKSEWKAARRCTRSALRGALEAQRPEGVNNEIDQPPRNRPELAHREKKKRPLLSLQGFVSSTPAQREQLLVRQSPQADPSVGGCGRAEV